MRIVTEIDTQTDAVLAQRALGGDRVAFAALLARHYDLMYRAAYRWSGRQADAEDVAQDVCIRLPRALRSWSGQGRFETWLYKVVLNAARDQGRKLARDGKLREAWANEPTIETDDDDTADRLWEAVRQLPPKQRMAVTLVYGEGVTHAEAAEAMDCAEATVSYHVHAARSRLKTLMEEAA